MAQALAQREEEIAALATDIDKRETGLEEREGLLRDAVAAAVRDRDEIGALEVERQCARYLGALRAARAATAALDAAREHARHATELERKAAAAREEAADLHAPAGAELEHLRTLETDWRIAREKLAVGLAVEVALERGGTAEVSIDGQSRQVRIAAGEPAALEAERELRLDLAGIGVVHVRGGGRDLLREAAAAEERWDGAAKPVLARAGCATLSALEALRARADALLETVSGLQRQAEQERARAENLDELERRAVVAKADVERRRAALAEGLNAGESVEEHVSGLDEPPHDETSVEQSIARLEAGVREREELRQQLEHAVAAEEREVASRRRDLADKQAEQRKAQDAGDDWRQVLAGAPAEEERLRRELEAVDAELAKIRIEATTEVEQARRALAELDTEEHRAREMLRETTGRWTTTRDELARLQGEAAELRATTQDEDIEAARDLRDRCRADLDALPAPAGEVAPERLAGAKDAATAAAADVRQLEMQLRAAEGALEQVGGQYIQERARQAREAVVALEERERELDLDYGAWRLLQEALVEAEQEEAVHLGKALVQPVSERVAALTGGRYGQVAIGPQLEAAGIQTAAGERKFDVLSVGTQEQIALLLRLSIAEALKAFIVLDDQLTQSDPARMTWMRNLLEAAASRIQVVVMTCHPEHYAVENGRRHVVDLSELCAATLIGPYRTSDSSRRPDPPAGGGACRHPLERHAQPGRRSRARRWRRICSPTSSTPPPATWCWRSHLVQDDAGARRSSPSELRLPRSPSWRDPSQSRGCPIRQRPSSELCGEGVEGRQRAHGCTASPSDRRPALAPERRYIQFVLRHAGHDDHGDHLNADGGAVAAGLRWRPCAAGRRPRFASRLTRRGNGVRKRSSPLGYGVALAMRELAVAVAISTRPTINRRSRVVSRTVRPGTPSSPLRREPVGPRRVAAGDPIGLWNAAG